MHCISVVQVWNFRFNTVARPPVSRAVWTLDHQKYTYLEEVVRMNIFWKSWCQSLLLKAVWHGYFVTRKSHISNFITGISRRTNIINFRLVVHITQYWNMNWPIAFSQLDSLAKCDSSNWNSILRFRTTNLTRPIHYPWFCTHKCFHFLISPFPHFSFPLFPFLLLGQPSSGLALEFSPARIDSRDRTDLVSPPASSYPPSHPPSHFRSFFRGRRLKNFA